MDASKTSFDDSDFLSKSESATHEPSSATGIFGTVSPQPAQPQEDDLLRSLLRSETPPASPASPAAQATPPPVSQTQEWSLPAPDTTPQPSASPGGFTQMFQALTNPPTASSTPATTPAAPPPSPVAPKPPSDLANLFTKISVEKSSLPDPPAQPSAQSPGEFTRMLRSLGNPAEQSASETHSPLSVETTKAAPSPGSFTQMFNAISAKPGESPQATPAMPTPRQWAPEPPQPAKQETSAPPGSFTQLFQSAQDPSGAGPQQPIPPVMPPQSAPSPAPGSFTEMFSQRSVEKTPFEDPLRSLRPEPVPERSYQFSNSPAQSSEPVPPAQGGFTQLLHALKKEESAPGQSAEPFMPPAPAPPAASPPAAGGFTQLLQTLSAEPAPRPVGQPPLAQPPAVSPMQPVFSSPPPGGGPGEFTRVISGSAFREMQGQSAAPVPPAAPAPARAGLPPMQMPQAPVYPQPPAYPQTPQMPHAGAAAPPAMPQFQPAPFAFPPAPAPPAPPPTAAPAPSKLQQYLPLILILNVFVLLVIVLILIFVLRHR
jgi:hypothetical protein